MLVVEDDPDTAQMLADFLAVEGFRVRVVRDSATAAEALATDGTDCVLLDIMLPAGQVSTFAGAYASARMSRFCSCPPAARTPTSYAGWRSAPTTTSSSQLHQPRS